jgi:hypothetical protein
LDAVYHSWGILSSTNVVSFGRNKASIVFAKFLTAIPMSKELKPVRCPVSEGRITTIKQKKNIVDFRMFPREAPQTRHMTVAVPSL